MYQLVLSYFLNFLHRLQIWVTHDNAGSSVWWNPSDDEIRSNQTSAER